MLRSKLTEMLRLMWSIRVFDSAAREMYHKNHRKDVEGEHRAQGTLFGDIHSYEGQEAIAVGACACLSGDDYVISTHRGHGHCLAKGVDMRLMMAELMGRKTGVSKGRGGSMHMFSPADGLLGSNGIVGGGIPLALGAAFSSQYRGTSQVTLCFFGDGGACEGTFHESLNLAAIWTLPVVFICENNRYAITISVEDSLSVPNIGDRAAAYGCPGAIVDGNDVLAVHEAVREAVNRAREGGGPTLIECKTFRWHGHCAALPDLRDSEEVREGMASDPIPRFEQYLLDEQIMTEEEQARLREEVDEALAEAIAFGESSDWPDPAEVAEYLWA